MNPVTFSHDCLHCFGLCCIAPAIGGEDFGNEIVSLPGIPCKNLNPESFRCKIFTCLEAHNFGGCRKYRCHGIGNKLSEILQSHGIANALQPRNTREESLIRIIYWVLKPLDNARQVVETLSQKDTTLIPWVAINQALKLLDGYLEMLRIRDLSEVDFYAIGIRIREMCYCIEELSREHCYRSKKNIYLESSTAIVTQVVRKNDFLPGHKQNVRKEYAFAASHLALMYYGDRSLVSNTGKESMLSLAQGVAERYSMFEKAGNLSSSKKGTAMIFELCEKYCHGLTKLP